MLTDDDLDWRPIASQAKTFWTIGATIPLVILVGVGIAVAIAADVAGLAIAAIVVGIGLWWWLRWVVVRRWRAWGYAERDRDLVLRHGVLFQTLTVVPYGRMQYVDVTQGPLDRWLGLSTVTLHTAAAATDASIPLLPTGEANRLRERLVRLGDLDAAGL